MAAIAFSARTSIVGGVESLARAMVEKAKPFITAAAERTGEAATGEILGIISSTYGQRQGKERSESLASASNYRHVVNERSKGVELVFKASGSDAFMKKFGSANYGSGPHVIAPRSAPALSNRQDTSRSPKGFFSKSPVMHPGQKGTQFWQRGIRKALDGFASRL